MRQCGILAFSFPVSMQGGGGGEKEGWRKVGGGTEKRDSC